MKDDTREQTSYNKLVGKIDNQYYFLDYTFKHSDDFRGATATVIEPVTKDDYEERTSTDNIREYLREIWQMQVADGSTEESLDDFTETAINIDGAEGIAFSDIVDDSRTELLREQFHLSTEDYPVFEVTGGGRSFSVDMVFDEVYDAELIKVIDEFEKREAKS